MTNSAAPGAAAPAARRFLTFRVGGQSYALTTEEIAEIIRLPPVARLPHSPPALLGVANLRGAVIPVASVNIMLGRGADPPAGAARAIVLSGAAPAALTVDQVDTIVTLDAAHVETRQAELSAAPGELLLGAFLTRATEAATKILDIRGLLAASFVPPPARAGRHAAHHGASPAAPAAAAPTARSLLVSFDAAGQEYALPLDETQEIIAVPPTIAAMPRADSNILGIVALRENLLPVLSLRGLLGLPPAAALDWRAKIIVTSVSGVLVGLVADKMREIVHAPPASIQPAPHILAARTGGETRIRAIYRNEAGTRLISILSAETLFGDDVMKRLGGAADHAKAQSGRFHDSQGALGQFLVFRLGNEEFGLPIAAVDEVTTLPTQITRLPKTPKFLEGVINLRGDVLPVIDQRRRFDMPHYEGDLGRRRLIVLRSAQHRAGLIVDGVSEVLSAPTAAIEPAPDLTGETTRLVDAVLNLAGANRMILILNPDELLSRAERSLLENFVAAQIPPPT